jgi:hypothetical protein
VPIYIEVKVDFSAYAPEGFGTVDVLIYDRATQTITVIDLKYGQGVKVVAKDNPQIRFYALGAYQFLGGEVVTHINMVIVQPRLKNVTSESMRLSELVTWGISIKPIAKKAFKGEGERKAGEWCRFCKLLPTCKAARDQVHETARMDFTEPLPDPDDVDTLTPEEMVKAYLSFDFIRSWMKALEDRIFNDLATGKDYPGLKLVRKKGRRKWSDDAAVLNVLIHELGLNPDEVSKTKPVGITDTKKMVSEVDFLLLLSPLIETPEGAPTIVTDDDPRPSLKESAADDFNDNFKL